MNKQQTITPEQIEIALELCSKAHRKCVHCAYSYDRVHCVNNLLRGALDYINNLKSDCDSKEQDTAQELLQILFDEAMEYGKTTDGIEHMANKYGVRLHK